METVFKNINGFVAN